MALITAVFRGPGHKITGYKYLWAKAVTGFNPTTHCAKALIGEYIKPINLGIALNRPFTIRFSGYFYLCGVSDPYSWFDNLHLAGVYEEGSKATAKMQDGVTVELTGLKALPIDDAHAQARFPDLGREYLSCRNFQFGAQYF